MNDATIATKDSKKIAIFVFNLLPLKSADIHVRPNLRGQSVAIGRRDKDAVQKLVERKRVGSTQPDVVGGKVSEVWRARRIAGHAYARVFAVQQADGRCGVVLGRRRCIREIGEVDQDAASSSHAHHVVAPVIDLRRAGLAVAHDKLAGVCGIGRKDDVADDPSILRCVVHAAE